MIRGVWHLEFMRTQIQHKHKKQEEFCITYNYLAESREPFESFVNDVVACKSVLFICLFVKIWTCLPQRATTSKLQPDTRSKVEDQRFGEFHGLLAYYSAFKPGNTHTFSTNLKEIKPFVLGFHSQMLERLFCSCFILMIVFFLLYLREKKWNLGSSL